jgi:hypothetical protein
MQCLSPSSAKSKAAVAPFFAYFVIRCRFFDHHTQVSSLAFEGKPVISALNELA